jgi:hypothetical protein
MKQFLTFALFILLIQQCFTQISFEKRIEIEIEESNQQTDLYNFGDKGAIVYSMNKDKKSKMLKLGFNFIDTDLQLVKSKSIEIENSYKYLNSFYDNNTLYVLFKSKNKLKLISANIDELNVDLLFHQIPIKAQINNFVVLNDYIYIEATAKKLPYIFTINRKSNVRNLIKIDIADYGSKHIRFVNFQASQTSNEVYVYLKVTQKNSTNSFHIMVLNDKGNRVANYKLNDQADNSILNARVTKATDQHLIVTGNYSKKNASIAEGIFFASIQANTPLLIKYYSFSSLSDFTKYLPQKKQDRIENKKAKKKSKGKEHSLTTLIAQHGIITIGDFYYYLGESYYPTYSSYTTISTTTVNGVTTTTTTTHTTFDGYQYTHAVLAKFDKEGNLIWDRIFKMDPDFKPMKVKLFISIAKDKQSSIKLAFASKDCIHSKSFSFDGDIVYDEKSDKIEKEYSDDKIIRSISDLDFWYDNYFIVHGTQKLKNKVDTSVNKKRKVFFVSKITYQ